MKTTANKKLYARKLANGKISVGEYLFAKWRNACDAINPNKPEEIASFWRMVSLYEERTKRTVELVPYRGNYEAAETLNNGRNAQ